MIINCKEISKIAALISPQETENIKNYIKNATADFCARYYSDKRVFTTNVYDKKSFLPSYMMISL